jgi:cysteine synthase A
MFPDYFFNLDGLLPDREVYLKLEGLQPTGSIKVKPAIFMIDDLERRGLLTPGESTIVESSSGNLGAALSLVCSERNYKFICVSDPNIAQPNENVIKAFGGQVIIVDKRDEKGGYLESRINFIHDLIEKNPSYVWLNQYANPANAVAHETWTAREILNHFPSLDYVFVGSGTTGTLMGIAERFRKDSPNTKIIAVEPVGSVTFDASQKGRRLIPGIGTSRRPELANEQMIDKVVFVEEVDTVKSCYWLAKNYGLLLGGSTGSVISAIRAMKDQLPVNSQVMAISPDGGDRYLQTIYSRQWVEEHFGDVALRLTGREENPPRPIFAPQGQLLQTLQKKLESLK